MPITPRQSAQNGVSRFGGRTVTVTLGSATAEGSLIVVDAACSTWDAATTLSLGASGFTLANETEQGKVKLARWYREGAPSLSSIAVTVNVDQSLQVRVSEYQGIRATAALDRTTVMSATSSDLDTGATAATTQADELVLATLVNLYESATQSGFSGGLTKLYETVSPNTSDADHDRTRMSNHQLVTTSTGSYRLQGSLSSSREWVGLLTTFKGGTTGPVAFSATDAPAAITIGGTASLSVFGPLASTDAPAAITIGGTATMHPFNHQYLLNAGTSSQLLIGGGTEYDVESIEGLEGWEVRTSDDQIPRGDGSFRGTDLQSARQIVFKVSTGGDLAATETLLGALYAGLVPQRDTDRDLVWRHPGQPVKLLRYRPTTLLREMTIDQVFLAYQTFTLLAADPRHYAPVTQTVTVPVTPAGSLPTPVGVINVGEGRAYPVIRVTGPTSGPVVTRVELTNDTGGVFFAVQLPLAAGSVLVADMDALVRSLPRSVVTLDGASVYGAWQAPRDPFFLAPAPAATGGVNIVYVHTTPEGAPVTVMITYRDTWPG